MTIAISNYNSLKGIDGSEVGEMCDGKGGWIGETDCTGQKTGQDEACGSNWTGRKDGIR